MKKILLYSFGILIVGACSQEKPVAVDEKTPPATTQEMEKPVVVPTKMLTMEIEGMSCEMGCGAAIRKELLATDAVERVKFDFKMGRDVNTAEISYDASKISEEKISAIVSEINDKQFKVGEASVKDYEKPEGETKAAASTKHATALSTENSFTQFESPDKFRIKTPNLIDLLVSALIRR